MDTVYIIMNFLSEQLVWVSLLGIAGQIFLSLRKKWFWGIMIPSVTLAITLYWLGNPMPSWMKDTPISTAMNIIFWLPITFVFLVIFVICRMIKRNK